VHDARGIGVTERKESFERRRHAELLLELAHGAGVERLPRRHHAADADVPVQGIDVLRRRAKVDVEPAATVEHEDVRAPVRQTVRAHLAAGRATDDRARLVDDVDEVVARIARRHASSSEPPIAASSSGVFTLSMLRAVPRMRRSSSSAT
jgi:hypothetical protein